MMQDPFEVIMRNVRRTAEEENIGNDNFFRESEQFYSCRPS